MISWIQNTFQKHFRLVFAILLAGMIVPFVLTIGSTPGLGRAEHTVTQRDFFGYNLASQLDVQKIHGEGQMSAELQRLQIYTEDQLDSYVNTRVAALHLADQYHIPGPTEEELKTYIQGLPAFAGQDGKFDVNTYNQLRQLQGKNEDTLLHVISEDYRASQIESLLAGPGYVLPRDVSNLVSIRDTQWTLSTAKLDYTSFKPSITPTDAELQKYFQQNAATYAVPEKVQVEMVDFPALAVFEQMTTTPAEVRAYYDDHPSEFPAPAPAAGKGPAVKPDANANFAAVQKQVEMKVKFAKARDQALKNASDFSVALYDGKIPRGDALVQFINSRHLSVRQLAPFSEQQQVPELENSEEATQQAFHLDGQKYFSDGLPTPSGATVLIWVARTPGHPGTLLEAHDKVLADYVENARKLRFAEAQRSVKSQSQAAVAQGQPFEKAAAAAGALAGVKVETKTYPAFSIADPKAAKDIPYEVQSTLESLKKGQVQDAADGYLVYAADAKAPVVSEANPDYAQIRMILAQRGAHTAPAAELPDMVETELARTAPSIK